MKKNELPIFDTGSANALVTEGIKYAGSKKKLLPHIVEMAQKTGARSVFDGFTGTSRVAQAFARSGFDVTCSDLSEWSRTFATCYLLGESREKYTSLIDELNNQAPIHGWYSENYGRCRDDITSDIKRPWQLHATRKLDAIRFRIDQLNLDPVSEAVAITSLINALDKVDSTIGHYASYLKSWSHRSFGELQLKIPQIVPKRDQKHRVLQGDIFDVIRDIDCDLAYFDPPYGSNNEKMPPSRVRYQAYYHIWKTICLNDEPELFGKANRRVDSKDNHEPSIFESYRKSESGQFEAVEALGRLISECRQEYVLLSYSSGGRATADELRFSLMQVGEILETRKIEHARNVMHSMRWTNEWVKIDEGKNIEYLFLLKRR